jgi:glycosyltransferase involved in cell wall biosynthesis
VIIPALDEEASIGAVLDAIPAWVDERIVIDNGCSDNTAAVAKTHGARVIEEPRPGYGAACLRGIAAARDADILVFLDADFSDDPAAMDRLVDPIVAGRADIAISDRTSTAEGRAAMSAAQLFGNRLACLLIRLFWGHRYHDLGPFRAVRRAALEGLAMADRDFGWTVEMQIRALKHKLAIAEVPVVYRERLAGRSKISGTLSGVFGAGRKILTVIFREALS